MQKRNRWIHGLIEEARTLTVQMPWERGLRRQAMIARRAVPALTELRAKRA